MCSAGQIKSGKYDGRVSMGNIKLESGELVKDRRINGNRLKLDIADWVKISITIFTTFAIITFGAGKLLTIVNNHTEVLAEQAKEVRKIPHIESDIVNIKDNVKYIRDKVDVIVLKIK